jgi:hypothetical protein
MKSIPYQIVYNPSWLSKFSTNYFVRVTTSAHSVHYIIVYLKKKKKKNPSTFNVTRQIVDNRT